MATIVSNKIKVGIVGPESTGKSTLAMKLVSLAGGAAIPEFARDYVSGLDHPYTYEDVCFIAEGNKMDAVLMSFYNDKPGFVFFDTELIVTKVWLDLVYGRRPEWLTEPIPEECRMDCYLLLKPDLPWTADAVRENGSQEARERLFRLYEKEIKLTGRPYAVVSGQGDERLRQAWESVQQLTGVVVDTSATADI